MPLPASLRNRTGSAPGEARPLLRGAQRPRGGGKLRGFAAHARRARERPERALFSAVDYGELSGFGRWVRPQPELSPQLVYPWGVTATGGYWQGVSRRFQRTRRRVLWRPSLGTFFDAKKVPRCRSTTDKPLRPSGGISKKAPTARRAAKSPPLPERQIQEVPRREAVTDPRRSWSGARRGRYPG